MNEKKKPKLLLENITILSNQKTIAGGTSAQRHDVCWKEEITNVNWWVQDLTPCLKACRMYFSIIGEFRRLVLRFNHVLYSKAEMGYLQNFLPKSALKNSGRGYKIGSVGEPETHFLVF